MLLSLGSDSTICQFFKACWVVVIKLFCGLGSKRVRNRLVSGAGETPWVRGVLRRKGIFGGRDFEARLRKTVSASRALSWLSFESQFPHPYCEVK